MSTIHASLDNYDQTELATARSPMEAIGSLRDAATDLAVRLLAGFQHHWTMHTMARFSDRRLRDVGFERDWDGSIIPIVDGQEASRWNSAHRHFAP